MTRIIFFTFLSLLCLSSGAQQIRVISSADRSPVPHVAVFTHDREKATIADTLGMLDLSSFRSNDTLLFQHPSYQTAEYVKRVLEERRSLALIPKNILIDEYVVSASRYRESKLIIPYMVSVLEKESLMKSTSQTAAGILETTGSIMVQRTQGGGGSPILRGFEANKVLLVVDGVRMNNAIYRSGHLQNSITIDNAILERAEVIFGPSSIIYGSDALGGVIHYYTREPQMSENEEALISGGAYARFSSANTGLTGHLDFSVGGQKWASLTSVTYKDLGDVRMGAKRNPTLGDWGKVMHYVDQVNGMDSSLVNEDPLKQLSTGYAQVDILQKLRYSPSRYVDWIVNLQYSTSSNLDRLDKLNDYNGENLKYAEYYYGPQERLLASVKNVLKRNNPIFTHMTNTLAYQRIDEDRYSRKFRVNDRLVQQEDVHVLSMNHDLLKIWGSKHRLNYGLEFNYNRVGSQAWYENIDDGDQRSALTRYPEGGSHTWTGGLYASHKYIMSSKMVMNGGLRYSLSNLYSSFTSGILPYDKIEIRNGALTASLGLVFTPTDNWQLNAILASGFRNPNVDDYGKIRAKDNYITVPNNELSPEYTYNAELGLSRIIAGYMKVELVGWYTFMRDAIVRIPWQMNGLDSLWYDGDPYRVSTNYNAGKAYIYGGSLRYTASFNKNIGLNGTLNYTRGQNLSDDVPLGHIPPFFGRTSLTYKQQRFYLDIYVVYQGWKHAEDFSPYGEDNDGEAMEFGFPSWWTANLKAGVSLGPGLDLMLAVENLFDQFYKPYASGLSAPGRNFILTARVDI